MEHRQAKSPIVNRLSSKRKHFNNSILLLYQYIMNTVEDDIDTLTVVVFRYLFINLKSNINAHFFPNNTSYAKNCQVETTVADSCCLHYCACATMYQTNCVAIETYGDPNKLCPVPRTWQYVTVQNHVSKHQQTSDTYICIKQHINISSFKEYLNGKGMDAMCSMHQF